MRYPATLTRDRNGMLLVTFPDIPWAVTFGDTIQDALAHGRSALLTAMDALIIAGSDIPEPSATGKYWVELPSRDAARIARYLARRT